MSVNKIFRLSPLLKENLSVAIKSIKTNRLRSILTILIIAIGITSLVGVLTATDALKKEVFSNFEKMGTTSFTIRARYFSSQTQQRSRIKNNRSISYYQAKTFKDQFDIPSIVTTIAYISDNIVVKYGSESTNPNISVVAADENYLSFKNTTVASGRGLMESDINSASFVCVLGAEIVKSLFKNEDPIGKVISISGIRYQVVGVIKSTGSSFGGSIDDEILIPVSNARSYFMGENTSFVVGIIPQGAMEDMDPVYDRAEHLFRSIRRLTPMDETDFRINRSDAMMSELTQITGIITIAAAVIGLITLLGAAVGLMNIMLVSVKERTREIGTRKAIGASSKRIKQQFLFESVVISQMGCLLGIVLGIIIGNITARLMGAQFIIPWMWMFFAVLVCFIVGVSSGYFPAVRASKLDPIEALRYE